jgi:integrase
MVVDYRFKSGHGSGHEWAQGCQMSRTLNRLSARQVAALKEPGRHADGGGLYLRVSAAGARSWVFMTVKEGKRAEIGLGSAASIPLTKARQLAVQMREAATGGTDPRSVTRREEPAPAPAITAFGDFAESYIASVEAGWKNPVHRQQWRNSLRDHAASLSAMRIESVDTDAVLAVLTPIWLAKPETASRLRGRIEKILNAAKARGLRPRESMNPAAWRGHLSLLLPAQSKLSRGHHAALPFEQAQTFMAELRTRSALAARCLEFTVLTAARSGEALGATWGEVDLTRKLWTVPAVRMKAGAEHVVPLSQPVLNLLSKLLPEQPSASARIFAVNGATRSNMAMTMLLRRMKVDNATVHGFRSTFRDWAGDTTGYPRELIEQALAHTVSNKAERAYRRGTAIERRRELMQAWAEYLAS